jgi:hypothetical protein
MPTRYANHLVTTFRIGPHSQHTQLLIDPHADSPLLRVEKIRLEVVSSS